MNIIYRVSESFVERFMSVARNMKKRAQKAVCNVIGGSVALCLAIIVAFAVAATAADKPMRLKVNLSCTAPWSPCMFGPEKTVKYPKVPKSVSVFLTPDISGAVKPHILIKDADGEVFGSLYLGNTSYHSAEGEAKKVTIASFEFDGTGGVGVNGVVDPPVELFALSFPCRAKTITSFFVGPISFDDVVVEDFSRDNKWHPIEVGDGVKLKLSRVSGAKGPPRPGHRNTWKFPERRENIIPSGDFEQGRGLPKGWHHGEAEYIPMGEDGKPAHDIAKHDAKYRWEDKGVQGFRSLSAEISKPGKWGGWDFSLSGIRSNTDYTISFWYRQPTRCVLRAYIFGSEVMLANMYTENPMHWIRYSEHFNSGDISGHANIGFHAECADVPVKVWIDEVEMYEGYSPIGYNLCRMQYYYHNFIYISPDMLSHAGFAFEHLFEQAKQPKEIDYVLELPEGVKIAGYWAAYWTWHPDHHRMSQEEIKIDDKPYTRYVITLRKRTDYKCRNHLVPIPQRDRWGGCVGGYCGWKQIQLWLATTRTKGEPEMRYYARWKGGAQAPQTLKLKVIRVPKVKPFRNFTCWVLTSGQDLAVCPDLIKDFPRVGINVVGGYVFGSASYKPSDDQKQNVAMIRKEGMRDVYCWSFNQPVFYAAKDDPEAHGMGLDGKRGKGPVKGVKNRQVPGWCLSYRGKVWDERVAYAKKMLDDGVNGFRFNDYAFCNCFCPKCKEAFKAFLAKFTDLPYKDPAEFMANPGTEPEYESLWSDFSTYQYGATAKELKDILQAYVREKDLPYKVSFVMSSGPTKADHPFAMKGIKEAFDSFSGQFYINCYHGWFHGSPKRIGDAVTSTAARLKTYGIPMKVAHLAPGLVYMHPECIMDPYEVMKYQVLEAALGADIGGYSLAAGGDVDLGVLANMAAANRILSKYEDIILGGEIVEGLTGGGQFKSVRAKKLGDKMLVLVGDYSTYKPEATEVSFKLPEAREFKDVETGQSLKPGPDGTYKVVLKESRQRVFYSGQMSKVESSK